MQGYRGRQGRRFRPDGFGHRVAFEVPLGNVKGFGLAGLRLFVSLEVPGDALDAVGLMAGVDFDFQVVDVIMPYVKRCCGGPLTASLGSAMRPSSTTTSNPWVSARITRKSQSVQ